MQCWERKNDERMGGTNMSGKLGRAETLGPEILQGVCVCVYIRRMKKMSCLFSASWKEQNLNYRMDNRLRYNYKLLF